MTDLVYITGGRSGWQDNELRYSLRSMCKHLSNMGNVFVVGTVPEWITGVTYIPATDYASEKKEPRLYRKRLIACGDERISPSAIFVYDDEYLLTDHDADKFPNYFSGTVLEYLKKMRGLNKKGHRTRCSENTVLALGPDAKLFDIHCPMLVNRSLFTQVMSRFDWNKKDGYLIKSIYGNRAAGGCIETRDVKINHPHGKVEEYMEMIQGARFFSTGDNMNWGTLKELMEWLYPEPSLYEK